MVTPDGKLSAQFEHTVAVTRDGVRVRTLRSEEGASSSALIRPRAQGQSSPRRCAPTVSTPAPHGLSPEERSSLK